MKYDKFYTKPEVAKQCYQILKNIYPNIDQKQFLEPSAGDGSFISILPNCVAYDILPEKEGIIQQDFLSLQPDGKQYVVIGNPPFGKRSKMAINFFNHSTLFGDIIAFILPVSFMKWSVQKELNKDFKLIYYNFLEPESFLVNKKSYSVRCVFQVWARESQIDLRLKSAPPTKHPDFHLWQYNATEQAKKYIDENWKYAVYRQGYKDYSILFTQKNKEQIKQEMEQNIQFFFIEPLTQQAEEFVKNCDFTLLAEMNTSTPGFGKGDFISLYTNNLRR